MAEFPLSLSLLLVLFLFGASLGSFWNLVADRLPLGQSIIAPASFCPECRTPVPWYGLIPVFGWFLVQGKCGACGAKVSPVHPLVETLSGLGTTHIVLHFLSLDELIRLASGSSLQGTSHTQNWVSLISTLWFFYLAIPLVIIDLRHRLLPNKLTFLGLGVSLILGVLNPSLGWQATLIGALVGGFSLLAVSFLYRVVRGREGLGMGDVKYLAFIGASVGWQKVFLCLGLASLVGSFVGFLALVFSPNRRSQGLQLSLPFGPFLAFGTLGVMLYGDALLALLMGSR